MSWGFGPVAPLCELDFSSSSGVIAPVRGDSPAEVQDEPGSGPAIGAQLFPKRVDLFGTTVRYDLELEETTEDWDVGKELSVFAAGDRLAIDAGN